MNGRTQRAYFSFWRPAGRPELLLPAQQRWRLAAAGVLSFLLHALVIVMPSPGTGVRAVRDAPRAIDVRLQKGETPATRTDVPPVAPVAVSAALPPPPPPYEPAARETRLSRGLDLLPAPAAPYFTTDRLTKQPLATSQPSLTVPRQTARYVSGRMMLRVWINELGGVDEVEVESSNLPETVYSLAVAAFRKLHFVPGEVDGRPVGVLMRIEIAYVDGRVLTQ
jgi:TonB family protein